MSPRSQYSPLSLETVTKIVNRVFWWAIPGAFSPVRGAVDEGVGDDAACISACVACFGEYSTNRFEQIVLHVVRGGAGLPRHWAPILLFVRRWKSRRIGEQT